MKKFIDNVFPYVVIAIWVTITGIAITWELLYPTKAPSSSLFPYSGDIVVAIGFAAISVLIAIIVGRITYSFLRR